MRLLGIVWLLHDATQSCSSLSTETWKSRFLEQDGCEDLFKGRGHKNFTTAYLNMWSSIVQQAYQQDLLLIDPTLDKVCHLSTGFSRSTS